jgi:ribosomal protein S18 acetylase RimI-like enzyme
MNPDHRIRKANLSDLDSLVAFAIQEATETEGHSPAPDAVTIGVQKGFEESAPSSYWVAESNEGEIVGAISVVTEWSNFRGGYYWWVQSLFIASDHRGRGLVDDLLRFIARTARAAHALDLRLYVLQSNHRAIAAYRRCGFQTAPYTIMTLEL